MRFYSNGKLLLTGEYLVLNGALSLALPSIYGQYLEVHNNNSNVIKWTSYDKSNRIWFECELNKENLNIIYSSSKNICKTIIRLITSIREIKPEFLKLTGSIIKTELTFSKDWGLGSSSTLISNFSKFAGINPFELNNKIFNGSGYDIACADSKSSLLYKLNGGKRVIKNVKYNPPFKENLYLVYLNKKQNSLNEIKKFKRNISSKIGTSEISDITKKIILCKDQSDFNFLIKEHEKIVSRIISKKRIKDKLFKDFDGEIKSLGAWGGDFVLVSASKSKPKYYFKRKGYNSIFKLNEVVYI